MRKRKREREREREKEREREFEYLSIPKSANHGGQKGKKCD